MNSEQFGEFWDCCDRVRSRHDVPSASGDLGATDEIAMWNVAWALVESLPALPSWGPLRRDPDVRRMVAILIDGQPHGTEAAKLKFLEGVRAEIERAS